MASLKTVQKNVNRRALESLSLPSSMYSNIYGSVLVCAMMFSEKNAEKKNDVAQLWRKVEKKPSLIEWALNDERFIDKTLEFFGLEKPKDFPIAFVQYGSCALFAPYIDGRVFPLREDGIKGAILMKGKVYPVNFESEVKADENK